MGSKTLAYNQLTTNLSAAIGLAKGLSIVNAITIVAPGTGYLVGDQITISGGTPLASAAGNKTVLDVTGVDENGAVQSVQVSNGGSSSGIYSSHPTGTLSTATNSANGAGFTCTATWHADTPPYGTQWAILEAEVQDVRITTDGVTTPTASVGMLLKAASSGTNSDFYTLKGGDVYRCLAIYAASGGILNVTFLRS